jgi:DNA repair exonuclease SbcCD ATPase subunit
MSFNISSVRFRNVFSFGNAWTEINLNQETATLIFGSNGAGKSTIYEAIFLCLYGKPFRKVKKGEIVNWLNEKDCEVEILASRDGDEFKIHRTISPSTLKVWINGVLRNQEASNKDPQEWLERSVIGMSERTFRQIVILGSTSYVPFMALSPAERRIVVDDILGLGVYAEMAQLAKKRLSETNESINNLSKRKSNLLGRSSELTISVTRLSSSNNDSVQKIKNTLDEVEIDLSKISEELETLHSRSEELKKKINVDKKNKLVEAIEQLNEIRTTSNVQLTQNNKQIQFFKMNPICPTCSQEISEKLRSEKIDLFSAENDEHSKRIEQSTQVLSQIKAKHLELQNLEDSQKQISNSISSNTTLQSAKRSQKSVILGQIESIQEIGDKELLSAQESLNQVTEELKSLQFDLDLLVVQVLELESIVKSLKDDGVKARIVRDFLPMINRLAAKWLKEMDMKIVFKFDEQFDETILVRGRQEYSYDTFSTGERLRIDLALLFAWREIAVLRGFSGCGLVIFDEIGGGSLDADGFSAFRRAIEISRKLGDCVLIISHQPDLLSDRCDVLLSISKETGFSKITKSTASREAILT